MKPIPAYNPDLAVSINLLNALIHIKDQLSEKPTSLPNCGICPTISRWASRIDNHPHRRQIVDKLEAAILFWPEHIGIENWPVGGPNEYAREQSNFELWQNPRRIALLDFLIDHLSK